MTTRRTALKACLAICITPLGCLGIRKKARSVIVAASWPKNRPPWPLSMYLKEGLPAEVRSVAQHENGVVWDLSRREGRLELTRRLVPPHFLEEYRKGAQQFWRPDAEPRPMPGAPGFELIPGDWHSEQIVARPPDSVLVYWKT